MWVIEIEKLVEYVKENSLIGCSGYSQKEQEEHMLDWISENCFKINDNNNIKC